MSTKIYLETFQAALEATRGTGIAAPTHIFPMISGTLTPKIAEFKPIESAGIMTKQFRHTVTRNWGEFELEVPADTAYMPFLLNALVVPLTSPATPAGATLARLWAHVPNQTADNIKTLTAWFGDTNVQMWLSDFAVMESISFTNDASSEEGATVSLNGYGNFPSKVASPTPAARITAGKLLPGMAMSLFLDTSSAIGTTAITGRLISATHDLGTGVGSGELKFLAQGEATTFDYSAISRNAEAVQLVTTITMEVIDMAQYDLFVANTDVKCRVRHNGALIESGFYHYIEFDTYGPLRELEWGEHATGNRTVTFTIESQYDATLAAPFRVAVQSIQTAL